MTTVNESTGAKRVTGVKILSKATTKQASFALQEYVDQFNTNVVQTNFKRTPKTGCYASSNVSPLLSTESESISSQRQATSSGKMVEDLVQWVNDSYSRDLQRKIVPFGDRSNASSVHTNGLEEESSDIESEVSTISDDDVQLSSLPSPGGSVVSDLDVGSVTTDVLVKTFHDNSQQSKGKGNHPSWVEELATPKHYPSWIDEIDESQITHQDTFNVKNNQRNRLSRSLSPSFFQQHLLPSPLSAMSASPQEHHTEISDKHKKKSIAWDLESTDTEVLITESIYGRQPVNMGGDLHSSLYRDKKIQQLHEQNVRKFAKDSERSLIKEMSFAQSHVEERKIKENMSSSTSQRLKNARNMTNVKTPKTKHARNSIPMKSSGREHQNSTQDRSPIKPDHSDKETFTSNSKPSSLQLPKRDGIQTEIRKNSTDSSNTDRLMRQSPTGIEMVKQDSSAESKYLENPRKNPGSYSTQVRTPPVIRTPNILHPGSPKDVGVTPRRNASEELQRIIELAELETTVDFRQRKEHYLNGRVSKTDLTAQDVRNTYPNNGRRNTPNGSHSKKYMHNSHPARIDSRNMSPRRLEPTNKYHRRIPHWNDNPTKNYKGNLYGTSTPGIQTSRNLTPSEFIPDTKTPRDRVFTSRLRTKSAPNIEGSRMWGSLPRRRRGYGFNVGSQNRVPRRGVHYVNEEMISDANYADEKILSERQDEETDSVDTEALVVKPPMPLFNVSPSLSTESAESSAGASDDTLIENLALRTSFLASGLRSSSENSYLEIPHQQGSERSEDWNRERPLNTRLNFNSKPGIITSFLEDCMRSSQQSRSDMKDEELRRNSVTEEDRSMVSDGSSDRPVETLKKMLFTAQRLQHPSEKNEGFETQSESLTEEILSEILSTASRNEGQDSLSRAYYHLARLKRLVSASEEVAAWK